jgi:hypothetical protein
VGCLFDSLIGIHKGLADEGILDIYSDVRKRIWTETIDPMSRENFRRLHDQDPDNARENDEFFNILVKAESDPGLAKELALVSLYRVSECFSLDMEANLQIRDWRSCGTI